MRISSLTSTGRALLAVMVVVAFAAPAGATRPAKPRTTPIDEITEAEVRIGESDWLASDGTAVWVTRGGGFVDRIDPSTNTVTASTKVSNEVCQGLGYGDGSVWSCSGFDLARIDPVTVAVVATIPVDKFKDQGHLPVAAGRVWVITGTDAATLVGVSTTTNTPEVSIPLAARCLDATAAHDAVWLACLSGEVLRIDPIAATVAARVGKLPLAASVEGNADAVFVHYEPGIAKIDPTTNTVTTRVKVAAGPYDPVEADDTSVWLRSERPFLRRFDATSLRLVERVTAATDSGGSMLVAFDSLWTSTYDDAFVVRLGPSA